MSGCGSVRWASAIRWYCNAVVAAAVSTAAVVMVVGKSKAGRDPDTNARRRGMVLIKTLAYLAWPVSKTEVVRRSASAPALLNWAICSLGHSAM